MMLCWHCHPHHSLVSPLVVQTLLPALGWHLRPNGAGVAGLASLPLFFWGCCPSHAGTCPITMVQSLYVVSSLCLSSFCCPCTCIVAVEFKLIVVCPSLSPFLCTLLAYCHIHHLCNRHLHCHCHCPRCHRHWRFQRTTRSCLLILALVRV